MHCSIAMHFLYEIVIKKCIATSQRTFLYEITIKKCIATSQRTFLYEITIKKQVNILYKYLKKVSNLLKHI